MVDINFPYKTLFLKGNLSIDNEEREIRPR